MAAAYSNRGDAHRDEILELIDTYKIGGLIFFQGGPVRQTQLVNFYQDKADVPLLVAMDAEWGVGMRLDSTIRYPYQMPLGAIQDNDLIFDMGAEIARQFKKNIFTSSLSVFISRNSARTETVGSTSSGFTTLKTIFPDFK